MAFIVITLIDYLFVIRYALFYIQHILYCEFNIVLHAILLLSKLHITLYSVVKLIPSLIITVFNGVLYII